VQFFQRVVLEWHPENPETYRIQRRLLGEDDSAAADDDEGEEAARPTAPTIGISQG
jgi:hypothetical protein